MEDHMLAAFPSAISVLPRQEDLKHRDTEITEIRVQSAFPRLIGRVKPCSASGPLVLYDVNRIPHTAVAPQFNRASAAIPGLPLLCVLCASVFQIKTEIRIMWPIHHSVSSGKISGISRLPKANMMLWQYRLAAKMISPPIWSRSIFGSCLAYNAPKITTRPSTRMRTR